MGSISYRDRNKGKFNKNGEKLKANWEYRFNAAPIAGKRKQIQASGFSTKKEAVEAATKAYQEYILGGSIFTETKMSFADCLDAWMKEYVAIECNDVTYANYAKKINLHINPALGKYRLTAIKPDIIQGFINDMYRRKYSRNSLTVMLGIISGALKFAKRQKWIRFNEAADVDIPTARVCKNLRKKERQPIPMNMISTIFERFPEGHSCHIPLILGYRGGLRIGEAFALTWDDVDFEGGCISVNHQVQWYKDAQAWRIVPPKYDSIRTIQMDDETMALLHREHERQMCAVSTYGKLYSQLYVDQYGYLNTIQRGMPIRMVTSRIDGTYIQPRVMQHCSFVIHTDLKYPAFDFHSLRHTHATALAEGGVNPKEIQRRLGHKSLEITTKEYIHATKQMENQSKAILNQLYKHNGEEE